ncbi:MAG: phosphoenolpyruvate--protein phosphotransferase [Burkholderiales bacterium]|jgi:phosphotransferase system enzyme I (PtsI)|nr:phosphoenolpyruvate--protein phosphotransferase [Burkholderiales bacterium]
MSFTMHGVAVSGGIAIGFAHLVSHAALDVPHYVLPQHLLEEEKARFDAAVAAVRAELEGMRAHIPPDAPPEVEAFLEVHLMILNDSSLSKVPKQLIEAQQCNAEWALTQQMENLLDQFERIEDPYLRERKQDVIQVVEKVLKELLGHPGVPAEARTPEEDSILVAHDLSPADMILFKRHKFAAFITDVGGATSHTAILARSLNIPSVVALHHARSLIREHELIIVDGDQGVVIVNPDQHVLAEYRLRKNQWELERQKLKRLAQTKTRTLDGTPVELHANIELPQDVAQVKENGATGIGLFRSEFLFMNRSDLPGEDEQFEFYRQVVAAMEGAPVTIRTLDLGADKQLSHAERPPSANPALGLRAIRLCLAEPQLFHTQLRAILRASHYGRVQILIPMLATVQELEHTLHLIEVAKKSLDADGIPYDRAVKVGGMIEIPAAALMAQTFVRKLDFLSIGTNDLIQYTLAIDRTDDSVAHLYDPLHPAVLQLVAHTIRTANRSGTPVAVCGEMAGDPKLTRLLLGFGLREFSMHPAHLLAVKQQVLKTNLPEVQNLVSKMLKTEEPEKIRALLARLNSL